jgi:hypothetical protein
MAKAFEVVNLAAEREEERAERLWAEAQLRAERRKNVRLGVRESLDETLQRVQALHSQVRLGEDGRCRALCWTKGVVGARAARWVWQWVGSEGLSWAVCKAGGPRIPSLQMRVVPAMRANAAAVEAAAAAHARAVADVAAANERALAAAEAAYEEGTAAVRQRNADRVGAAIPLKRTFL